MRILRTVLTTILAAIAMTVGAQHITGVVVDAATGDSIASVSIKYNGVKASVVGNLDGTFRIDRLDGRYATFSAVGYQSLRILVDTNSPEHMRITLKPDTKNLSGVTVKGKKSKYKRKDNPAIALMKRVIAAKKRTDIANHDYYSYDKYQKLTVAVNDISPSELETRNGKKPAAWMANQVEMCEYNNKLILPMMLDENLSRHIYRKDPRKEKTFVLAQHTDGVNKLMNTGDIMNTVFKDIFSSVDIYDEQIRLLQTRFTSPIANDATQFYKFSIGDTVKLDRDSCFHIYFTPNNQQDFGFRGELWVLKDSTLHVKRCQLKLPIHTGVNFVKNLLIDQEYTQLDNGEWVLSKDDLVAEMSLLDILTKGIVIKNTRLQNYSFSELPAKQFKGMQKEVTDPDANIRSEEYWRQNRLVPLTRSEARMPQMLKDIENTKHFKLLLFGLKVMVENFVETGSVNTPSKFDIGPVNTFITSNFIDGTRTRLSGQTTANLSPHFFAKGYYAHGWDSKKNYYNCELTYSINKKQYLTHEYPKRHIQFVTTYDVCSPSDKFLITDKDNVFTSLKWQKVDKMMRYNRQQLSFEYEMYGGLSTTLRVKTEENEACGKLHYVPLSMSRDNQYGIGKMRTTEATFVLRYAPGETIINTKKRRRSINYEAPIFSLSHTMGVKGVLGGDYNYNFTEMTFYKRFWMKSWGNLNVDVRAGAQWNKVPYPLLIMPAANMSYIAQYGTFNLINNMEFLNDRYASLDMWWDMNGKIFNRVPLLKKLKWREYIGVKCLWGNLTEKNNPFAKANAGDKTLMYFPEGSYVMDHKKPYMELAVGVSNIFKFFSVEYVRRLNYLDQSDARKHGIRFDFDFKF